MRTTDTKGARNELSEVSSRSVPPVNQADAENVEFVGCIGGATYSVAVLGDHAYIGEGPRLTILDISNSASPTMVGKTDPLPGVVHDIQICGGFDYVAASYGDLQVVDVSDRAHPTEVGTYFTPGKAFGEHVSGSTAYVALANRGLRVVDVSDAAHPSEVGYFDTPGNARGVYA